MPSTVAATPLYLEFHRSGIWQNNLASSRVRMSHKHHLVGFPVRVISSRNSNQCLLAAASTYLGLHRSGIWQNNLTSWHFRRSDTPECQIMRLIPYFVYAGMQVKCVVCCPAPVEGGERCQRPLTNTRERIAGEIALSPSIGS